VAAAALAYYTFEPPLENVTLNLLKVGGGGGSSGGDGYYCLQPLSPPRLPTKQSNYSSFFSSYCHWLRFHYNYLHFYEMDSHVLTKFFFKQL
jgi:hypothetical protein